jgi:hypothetical protein
MEKLIMCVEERVEGKWRLIEVKDFNPSQELENSIKLLGAKSIKSLKNIQKETAFEILSRTNSDVTLSILDLTNISEELLNALPSPSAGELVVAVNDAKLYQTNNIRGLIFRGNM